jgi:hypothetical protein
LTAPAKSLSKSQVRGPQGGELDSTEDAQDEVRAEVGLQAAQKADHRSKANEPMINMATAAA